MDIERLKEAVEMVKKYNLAYSDETELKQSLQTIISLAESVIKVTGKWPTIAGRVSMEKIENILNNTKYEQAAEDPGCIDLQKTNKVKAQAIRNCIVGKETQDE